MNKISKGDGKTKGTLKGREKLPHREEEGDREQRWFLKK